MKQNASSILKKAKFKITPARLAILSAFSPDCKPMSAEDIFKKVKNVADQVTVYRTLSSFEEKGIIKKVNLRKDSVYYELSNDHHHHIVCKECGVIEGFDICEMENVSKKILGKSGKFSIITEHSLELFGMCKSCSK